MGNRYAKSKKETDTGRKIGGKEANTVWKSNFKFKRLGGYFV